MEFCSCMSIKFFAENLSKVMFEINGLAKQGWRLISTSISTDVRSGGDKTNVRRISTSSELYLFFERETGQSS